MSRREKPIARRGRAADAVAEKALEKNPQQHRAPADEDRGGIKIRHRRPAFQIHPRDQARGVHDERQHEQREGVAPERFRPDQPRGAREDKDQHVEHHRAVERLQAD